MSTMRSLLPFALKLCVLAFAVTTANAQLAFQGFEMNTGDWTPSHPGCDTITRVPSGGGALHLPSYDGNFHAEITNCDDDYSISNGYGLGFGDSEFSFFGLPKSGVYQGDFAQTISVYIFANWAPPVPYPSEPAFWIDMAPSGVQGPGDTRYAGEHNFRLSATGTSVLVRVDGNPAPITTITTSGWYTFQITWRKDPNPNNPVLSDMNVFDAAGHQIGTITVIANSPEVAPYTSPLLSKDLAGPSYVWFTVWQNGFAHDVLAIDDARVDLLQLSDAFQISYASNLNIGDSYVDITNTGSSSSGNICVNVYAFDAAEEMIACCSCPVTPNGLKSLSVRNDITSNTLTVGIPNSVVLKLLATNAQAGTLCNPASPVSGLAPGTSQTPAPGLRAWGTTLHALSGSGAYGLTERPFSTLSLTAGELTQVTTTCGFIQSVGSGFGICTGCEFGGLGASQQ